MSRKEYCEMKRTSVYLPYWMINIAHANNLNLSRILREAILSLFPEYALENALAGYVLRLLGGKEYCRKHCSPLVVKQMFQSWRIEYRIPKDVAERYAKKYIKLWGVTEIEENNNAVYEV